MKTNEAHENGAAAAGANAFAVTALVMLALGCLALAVRPGFLLGETLTGHGEAWIRLMIFGFGLPAVFGAVYRALPEAFGVQLFSGPAVFLHYGFHIAGLLIVLAIPFVPDLPQASMGATFLACGGVVFVVNVAMSLRKLGDTDAGSAFLSTLMVWLVAALFLGIPFAATPPLPFLAGTNWSAGWLVFVMSGVLFNAQLGLALRVTPLVVGANTRRASASWYALSILNLGVAWMFAGATFGPLAFLLVCAVVFLIGSLVYLGDFWGMLQSRTDRGTLGWDSKIMLGSVWMIPATAIVLLYAVWERLQAQAAEAVDAAAAGAAAAVVPAAPAVAEGPVPLAVMSLDWTVGLTALLATAVPGLVAVIFQLQKLRAGVPGEVNEMDMRERVSGQVLLAAFFNYAVGAALVIVGAWGAEVQMLGLGAVFLVVGALGFIGIFLHHMFRPSDASAPRLAGAAA